jgi:hypothetical protein
MRGQRIERLSQSVISHPMATRRVKALPAAAPAAGSTSPYSRWPGIWHDFALRPGILAAADSALAQAAWLLELVSSPRH